MEKLTIWDKLAFVAMSIGGCIVLSMCSYKGAQHVLIPFLDAVDNGAVWANAIFWITFAGLAFVTLKAVKSEAGRR